MPDKEDEANESSEEEDDDVADEPPPPPPQGTRKARQSVSAEAYGAWNVKTEFEPPVIPKSDDQKARLKAVLSKSFMFASLDEAEFNVIINAMKEIPVPKGTRIIQQKDDGDTLYVIESGTFDCLIKFEDGNEKVVKTCVSGDVFGELALLYNVPRAASVESKDEALVWQLDRATFNHIVKDGAQNKRNRYDAFLAKVPLLSGMDQYERSQLADALRVETFADAETVVTQGEVGQKFYIIEEGAAVALKDGAEVMHYAVGDYFGELALLRDQARAASVRTKGATKLLSIDSATFNRLLDVADLEARSQKYT